MKFFRRRIYKVRHLRRYFPSHYHVLPPVQECVEREVDGEREAGDEDDKPKETVAEGEERCEHVVDAVDCGVVRVLLDRVEENSLLNRDALILFV